MRWCTIPSQTIVTVYIVLVLPVTRASTHPVLLDTVAILHLACTKANVEDMHKPKEKSDSEKALEERIAKLEAREKELANKEQSMTLASKLKEKNLPTDLAK